MEEHFGVRLVELAKRASVWIISSSENSAAVEKIWKLSTKSNVTLFEPMGKTTFGTLAVSIENIEQHHGVESCDPPFFELQAIGVQLTQEIVGLLGEYDLTSVVETEDGFRAFKIRAKSGTV